MKNKRGLITIIFIAILLMLSPLVQAVDLPATIARDADDNVVLTITVPSGATDIEYAISNDITPAPASSAFVPITKTGDTIKITLGKDHALIKNKTLLYIWITAEVGGTPEDLCEAQFLSIPAENTVFSDYSSAKFSSKWKENNAEILNQIIQISGVKNLVTTHSHYVHLSHNKADTPTVPSSFVASTEWILTDKESGGVSVPTFYSSPIFEEAGDIYLWILEVNPKTNAYKMQVTGQKIERLVPNTKILKAFFFSEKTNTYQFLHGNASVTRKMSYKIGVISDNAVISALQSGNANAYSLLMNYAKAHTAPLGTGKLDVGDNAGIINALDIKDNQMYYGYLSLDTENGKYFAVEDVDIYFGSVGKASDGSTEKGLFDKTNPNFKYTLNGDGVTPPVTTTPPADDTVAKTPIPNAGMSTLAIAILGIVAMGTVSYIFYKKTKIK